MGKGRTNGDGRSNPTMDFLRKVGANDESSFRAQNNISFLLEVWQVLLKKLKENQARERDMKKEVNYVRAR